MPRRCSPRVRLIFSKAERETVASYVSYLNGCVFWSKIHGAVADHHWGRAGLSREVWTDTEFAPISDRLKRLLAIARKVRGDAKTVTAADLSSAIASGDTERDIYDTVLTAAAFCLFNRYKLTP